MYAQLPGCTAHTVYAVHIHVYCTNFKMRYTGMCTQIIMHAQTAHVTRQFVKHLQSSSTSAAHTLSCTVGNLILGLFHNFPEIQPFSNYYFMNTTSKLFTISDTYTEFTCKFFFMHVFADGRPFSVVSDQTKGSTSAQNKLGVKG